MVQGIGSVWMFYVKTKIRKWESIDGIDKLTYLMLCKHETRNARFPLSKIAKDFSILYEMNALIDALNRNAKTWYF